jgi:hypothetical protein
VKTGKESFLLPSYHKYGLKSFKDYEKQYLKGKGIRTVGVKGWFDIQGDYVYFVWEGDLKIFKINIKSGEINAFEGEKTTGYVKPHVSENLLRGYWELGEGNSNRIKRERSEMSYVRNIFTNGNYIYVVVEGPGKSNFRMQFYSLNGVFINEAPIPGKPDSRMYLDKERNVLYSLSSELAEDSNERYFMLEYKIGNQKKKTKYHLLTLQSELKN